MKLFVICMIRNEIDILPSFLNHIASLFDGGCLIDHLSNDGSEILMREFVLSQKGWIYQSLQTQAYLQAEKSTEGMQHGFAEGADAVFFLDADEFISGMNRDILEGAIALLDAKKSVGYLRWRNCMPADYKKPFSLYNQIWLCGLAAHRKLVVPRWIYRRFGKEIQVNQGNHSLRLPSNDRLVTTDIGEILHFPIRSRPQFIRKILISYASQMAKPDKIIAPHIQMLSDALCESDFTAEIMNALAVKYSVKMNKIEPLMSADLEKHGYKLGLPNISTSRKDMIATQARSLTCAIITPVGPGHESLVREAQASVEAATNANPGLFSQVTFLAMPDEEGKYGRSNRRNDGIDFALTNKFDWLFFLDADDLMATDAFASAASYVNDYDAVFGLIAEAPADKPTQFKLRTQQLGPTSDLNDILQHDPFLTLQMGHFVRTEVAAAIRFDSSMDTGEDFKYYLNLWNKFRCRKIDKFLFVNRRGAHSTGPRSADGGGWRNAVTKVFKEFCAANGFNSVLPWQNK